MEPIKDETNLIINGHETKIKKLRSLNEVQKMVKSKTSWSVMKTVYKYLQNGFVTIYFYFDNFFFSSQRIIL